MIGGEHGNDDKVVRSGDLKFEGKFGKCKQIAGHGKQCRAILPLQQSGAHATEFDHSHGCTKLLSRAICAAFPLVLIRDKRESPVQVARPFVTEPIRDAIDLVWSDGRLLILATSQKGLACSASQKGLISELI
jgi:hypothetical protein